MPRIVNYDALRTAYFDPAQGLRSAEGLWRKLRPQYTLAEVRVWIDQQDVQQRFHERKAPKPYQPMSRGQAPFARVQQDLLDVRSYNTNRNEGIQYLMLTVDAWSKYLVCIPIKSKANSEVVPALKETIKLLALQNTGFPPSVIDSDNEPAFCSAPYRAELKEDLIEQNLCDPGDHKALAYVNRVCRTMRSLINRYREISRSSSYIDALPELIANYNSSYHKAIGTTPELAAKQTEQPQQIEDRIDRQKSKASRQTFYRADIEMGSNVRVLLPSQLFTKLTRARWSAKVYTVTRIVAGVFFYVRGETKRYRKYELLLVSAPSDGSESEDEKEEKYPSDDEDEKEEAVDDQDNDYATQRRIERRIAREGFEPHQYSGDPHNSLEQRYADEVARLPATRPRPNR